MEGMTLDGHVGTSLDIDICERCQAFWFDRHESLRLAPVATLKLFTLIGERSEARQGRLADLLKCPRCSMRLRPTHDLQGNTRFRYWRCPMRHGRLITFFDFLREKKFIRPLTARQIDELREHVQAVNCSNCGAPIDLAQSTSCGHCRSPLSMLDLKQTKEVVAQLQAASQPTVVDPSLPLELARARREVDSAFASMGGDAVWWRDASSFGVVEAGLSAVARWLRKTGRLGA
jgi:hypothetical protein